jgi:YidC/Oxa1 family membrane protein insertase
MIASNPISVPWQALLDAIGAVLAFLYSVIPSYGIDIIVLTLLLRVLLIPLAVKQIRSMQAMQTIQPKVRAVQQKFKGDRQRISEETMKLYREHGVNPFSGCLPVIAQFPVLIALYGVLVVPNGLPHIRGTSAPARPGDPATTRLYRDITTEGQNPGVHFLGMNLICAAREAGSGLQDAEDKRVAVSSAVPKVTNAQGKKVPDPRYTFARDCEGAVARVPAFLLLAAMVATTYYSQRQMQKASPAANPQQQMLTRIMPVFFGVIGINFPSGLVLYWTTTNLVQIVQQRYMLPRYAAQASVGKGGDGAKRSLTDGGSGKRAGTQGPRGAQGPGKRAGSGTGGNAAGDKRRGSSSQPKPGQGQRRQGGGQTQGSSGGGGRDGGDRKKRRKR